MILMLASSVHTIDVLEILFLELEKAWDDVYASCYGFWRDYIMIVNYWQSSVPSKFSSVYGRIHLQKNEICLNA